MWLRDLAALGLLSATALVAQTAAVGPDWTPKSRHGTLTIWRVVTVGPPRPVSVASLSPEVRTQTSGSFGQTAGSFGSTAGSTGQTAGSFGQNAGASSKTAGSAGQSVGSFGESLNTLANAAAASNGSQGAVKYDAAWDSFTGQVRDGLGGFNVSYEDVGADELQTRLDAVAGKREAPDVLVGTPLPLVWSRPDSGLVRRYGLVTLGVVSLIPQTEAPEFRSTRPDASILVRAPHPRAARAFVRWLSDRNAGEGIDLAWPKADAPVAVAKSALAGVLYGGEIGAAADKQMASFSPKAAQQVAMAAAGSGLLDELNVEIDATDAAANERFAVVQLRAVMESRAAFGVAHAVVVLRADDAGRWRVLQLTPNLVVEQQEVARRSLAGFGASVKREEVSQLSAASLAAPVDGDNRSPVPDFWWDNEGTGTLEIIEWQRSAGKSWTSSNMYFVPEEAGHLRTRTTGRFADTEGSYRWRVWSMGKGGVVAMSAWRALNISAH